MSLTNTIDEAPPRNGARLYPRTLPQPILDKLRPIARGISRMLWSVEWRHTERIPREGGVIIAANHQTYVDPVWVAIPVNRPTRFLAWDEAFEWPIVGKTLTWLGAWPLQLEKSDPTAIKRTYQWLRDGGAVVLFPEGGRGNPDASMRKFKPGAVRIALETEVPILPVTIRGGEKVWPNTLRLPRFRRHVEVIYHPPMVVQPRENEDVRECARRESERLAAIINSAL